MMFVQIAQCPKSAPGLYTQPFRQPDPGQRLNKSLFQFNLVLSSFADDCRRKAPIEFVIYVRRKVELGLVNGEAFLAPFAFFPNREPGYFRVVLRKAAISAIKDEPDRGIKAVITMVRCALRTDVCWGGVTGCAAGFLFSISESFVSNSVIRLS